MLESVLMFYDQPLINVSNERVHGYMRPQSNFAEKHYTWWNNGYRTNPYYSWNRPKVETTTPEVSAQAAKDAEALQMVRQELLSLVESQSTANEAESQVAIFEYDGLVPSGD